MERRITAERDYSAMHERVQEALKAVGTVERAIGDLGTDELLRATREELNTAVTSLQDVRDWLSDRMST